MEQKVNRMFAQVDRKNRLRQMYVPNFTEKLSEHGFANIRSIKKEAPEWASLDISDETHEYKEITHHYYLYCGTVLKGTDIIDGIGRMIYETTVLEGQFRAGKNCGYFRLLDSNFIATGYTKNG